MYVTFGQKIPVSEFQIKNNKTNKFEKAKLYEFDCKDSSDIEYFVEKDGEWKYKPLIIRDMLFRNQKIKNFNSLSEPEKQIMKSNRYFALEADDKSLIGICETRGYNSTTDIHFIETSKEHKYKYAGQGIIAALAKHLLNKNQNSNLAIYLPLYEARKFYIEKCGFKDNESYTLSMNSDEMKQSIDSFEAKTQSKIINLSA